ncbi:MAG: DNA mismatch repair protein MutS [Bacteroidia bacterium]|nr:DNA mismatch repair protein MutS [Bacteroidia bacterium]
MTFKSALDIDCGIRFIYDCLQINSSCGRKYLLESQIMKSKREIDIYYEKLNELYDKDCRPISNKLMCLKDIYGTISRLAAGKILDDIELFEIKYLSLICGETDLVLQQQRIRAVNLPDLKEVVSILDPDNLNIPSFYIYDSYSEELTQVRKQMKGLKDYDKELNESNQSEYLELKKINDELEYKVRVDLSGRLLKFAQKLEHALKNLSFLDVLVAKVFLMKKLGLCFPAVAYECETFYHKMYNPMVESLLQQKGKEFTPVDFSFSTKPVTIIGANMGGKTVVLKTLALNQILAQFGFGVAARSCCVNIVDKILLCVGDDQNVQAGLSSFAAEMLSINNVVNCVRAGENVLSLIDEPARTTNPVEGTALVEGLLELISDTKGGLVLTTHYNIKNDKVKRYRVSGLKDGIMDYTLVEADSGDVPHEAVAIAESLGIDTQWIELTKKHLNN